MQDSVTAKIKSGRKSLRKRTIIDASVALAVLLFAIGFTYEIVRAPEADLRTVRATLDDETFWLQVAEENEDRIQGLADRPKLEEGDGMLFVFDNPDTQCFWMKDVDYAIDILWFDADMQQVHAEESVAPDSYPSTFCPPEPAQYVVELLPDALDSPEGLTLYVENL